MSCGQHDKSCGGCPFSRRCKPGELGGSPITKYLGQIIGPFFLPCHQADGYMGNATPMTPEHAQCSGAAIFRANIGVDDMMPDPLLKLPAGSDPNVFSTVEEFIRHHHPELEDGMVEMLQHTMGMLRTQEMAQAHGLGKPMVPSSELVKLWEEVGHE